MRKIVYLLLGALFLFSCKDDDEALLKPENIQGGETGENQGEIIRISSSKNVVQGDSSFVLTVTLPEGKVEEYPLTLDLKVVRNYNGEDVNQKTLFEDFPAQLIIPAGKASISDTIKVKQNEEKNQEFEVKISTSSIEGYTIQPSPLVILLQYTKKETGDGPEVSTNEIKVYDDPAKPIYTYAGFGVGADHPNAELAQKWKFYTGHEFLTADLTAWNVPMGFWDHNTAGVEGNLLAVNNGECTRLIAKDGYEGDSYMRMFSQWVDEPVRNSQGNFVNYKTASLYACRPSQGPHWCNFQEGTRIEVRMRRTNHGHFNYGIWFMGGSNTSGGVSWPKCGEIDLVESPFFGQAHFSLHSEHSFTGEGGTGSVTGHINIPDQSQWNIYWMEWTTDEIKAGLNDETFFTQKLDESYEDANVWLVRSGNGPNFGKGFNLILTTGLGAGWAGGALDYDIDPLDPPAMEIDWIRVWQQKGVEIPAAPTGPGPKGAVYWKPKN